MAVIIIILLLIIDLIIEVQKKNYRLVLWKVLDVAGVLQYLTTPITIQESCKLHQFADATSDSTPASSVYLGLITESGAIQVNRYYSQVLVAHVYISHDFR